MFNCGNHDGSWMTKLDASKYFESIDEFINTTDSLHSMTLCHHHSLLGSIQTEIILYPLIASRENVLNAGVDISNFVPVTLEELIKNNNDFKEKYLNTK